MGLEIERKFLVVSDEWRGLADGVTYRQGYLSSVKERVVRVRTAGDRAFLTVKGLTLDYARVEFEYAIPLADAIYMLDALCERPLISKRRYTIPWRGLAWEVDEFLDENIGLIVAEIELPNPSAPFERPPWIGAEISNDPRYFNANLIRHPFSEWGT